MTVDRREIGEMVKVALSLLYCNEKWLIDHHCHEVNIVGAFYYYFRGAFGMRFPSYSIDMEYNRQGTNGDTKLVFVGEEQQVRSDFVIHKRGRKDNLLVIEFKTEWSDGDRQWDIEKLEAMTKNDENNSHVVSGYRYGLSVVLMKRGANLVWVKTAIAIRKRNSGACRGGVCNYGRRIR